MEVEQGVKGNESSIVAVSAIKKKRIMYNDAPRPSNFLVVAMGCWPLRRCISLLGRFLAASAAFRSLLLLRALHLLIERVKRKEFWKQMFLMNKNCSKKTFY